MNQKNDAMVLALDFVERVTHWKERGPDRHDVLVALRAAVAQSVVPQTGQEFTALDTTDTVVQQEQPASKDVEEIIKLRGVLTSIEALLGHDPIDFAIIGEMIFQALKEPVAQPEQPAPIAQAEPACSDHPDAPHGFDRNASHSAHRYVCDCEGWMPDEESADPLQSMIDTSQELGLYDDAHSNIAQPKDRP